MELLTEEIDESMKFFTLPAEGHQSTNLSRLQKFLNSPLSGSQLGRPTIIHSARSNRKFSNDEILLKQTNYQSTTEEDNGHTNFPLIGIHHTKNNFNLSSHQSKYDRFLMPQASKMSKMSEISLLSSPPNTNKSLTKALIKGFNSVKSANSVIKSFKEAKNLKNKDSKLLNTHNEIRTFTNTSQASQIENLLKSTNNIGLQDPEQIVNSSIVTGIILKTEESNKGLRQRKSNANKNQVTVKEEIQTVTLSKVIRRKSCHCSDCGGISNFEKSHLNVLDPSIKKNRFRRKKTDEELNWEKFMVGKHQSLAGSSFSIRDVESFEDISPKAQRFKLRLDGIIEELRKDSKSSKTKNMISESPPAERSSRKKFSIPLEQTNYVITSSRLSTQHAANDAIIPSGKRDFFQPRKETADSIERKVIERNISGIESNLKHRNNRIAFDFKEGDFLNSAKKLLFTHSRNAAPKIQEIKRIRTSSTNRIEPIAAQTLNLTSYKLAFEQLKGKNIENEMVELFPRFRPSKKHRRINSIPDRKKSQGKAIKEIYGVYASNTTKSFFPSQFFTHEMNSSSRVHTTPSRPKAEYSSTPSTSARKLRSSKLNLPLPVQEWNKITSKPLEFALTARIERSSGPLEAQVNNLKAEIEGREDYGRMLESADIKSSRLKLPERKLRLKSRSSVKKTLEKDLIEIYKKKGKEVKPNLVIKQNNRIVCL